MSLSRLNLQWYKSQVRRLLSLKCKSMEIRKRDFYPTILLQSLTDDEQTSSFRTLFRLRYTESSIADFQKQAVIRIWPESICHEMLAAQLSTSGRLKLPNLGMLDKQASTHHVLAKASPNKLAKFWYIKCPIGIGGDGNLAGQIESAIALFQF